MDSTTGFSNTPTLLLDEWVHLPLPKHVNPIELTYNLAPIFKGSSTPIMDHWLMAKWIYMWKMEQELLL